jgi:hypothetical protein
MCSTRPVAAGSHRKRWRRFISKNSSTMRTKRSTVSSPGMIFSFASSSLECGQSLVTHNTDVLKVRAPTKSWRSATHISPTAQKHFALRHSTEWQKAKCHPRLREKGSWSLALSRCCPTTNSSRRCGSGQCFVFLIFQQRRRWIR